MGLSATGDEYCRRGARITDELENTERVMEDTLFYDTDVKQHYEKVRKYLLKCRENQITLNRDKFEFAQRELKYVGYIVGADGISADPEKIRAINDFPKPTNISELRSFLGLSNQLGNFTKELSALTQPFRDLLKTKNQYLWLPQHDEAFLNLKTHLSST